MNALCCVRGLWVQRQHCHGMWMPCSLLGTTLLLFTLLSSLLTPGQHGGFLCFVYTPVEICSVVLVFFLSHTI